MPTTISRRMRLDMDNLRQMNISQALWGKDGCMDKQRAFYAAGTSASSNVICLEADTYCADYVFTPAVENHDPYDLRQNSSALFPPKYYIDYLNTPVVVKQIGAETRFNACSHEPNSLVIQTGDDARTFLPQLSKLANSGLKILIWVIFLVACMCRFTPWSILGLCFRPSNELEWQGRV